MPEIAISEILAEYGSEEPLGFADLVRAISRREPERLAVEYQDRRISYGELVDHVAGAAWHLESIGIQRGDRVAYMLRGHPNALYTMLAATLVGALLVPVNPEMEGEILTSLIDRYGLTAIVTDPTNHDVAAEANSHARTKAMLIPSRSGPYASAIDDGGDIGPLLSRDYPTSADPGLILSTSGTTGEPKGVVHAGSWAMSGLISARKWGFDAPPKQLLALSWGYVAPVYQCSMAFFLGGSVVIIDRFSASTFWETFARYGCSHVHLMGTMPRMLMNQPASPSDSEHTPAVVTSAGMPADIWSDFERRFGATVFETYSSVDSGGCWMSNPGTYPAGSVGAPWIENEARIVDTEGNDVSVGEVGELLMRPLSGPPVVNYLNDPEASAEKTVGGWVHLGDYFRQEADGSFWFVDRKRDLIRRRAMGVAPAAVEELLRKLVGVADAAVIGVPDTLGEDEIKAVIVTTSGADLPLEEVVKHIESTLPRYMRPRYVEFVAELPVTPVTEKVQRFRLKTDWRNSGTWDLATMRRVEVES
jgi:crotonobetaine/carnitine-CoA ligase